MTATNGEQPAQKQPNIGVDYTKFAPSQKEFGSWPAKQNILVDYSTFALLPTATNGADGMVVQKREGGKLSIVNNKHPTPFEQPAQKYFDSWPHKTAVEQVVDPFTSPVSEPPVIHEEVIHEEMDPETIRADLADLMIDEDGEIVRVTDDSSECADVAEVANIFEFISSSTDETSSSSDSEEQAKKPTPQRNASWIATTADTFDDSDGWSTVTRRNSRRTPTGRATPRRTSATPRRTPTATPRSTTATPRSKSLRSRRSRSQKKQLFRFPSSNTPYTPFPPPSPSVKTSTNSKPKEIPTPEHSSPPSSSSTPPLVDQYGPFSSKNSSPLNHPCISPSATASNVDVDADDVAQLRSLHNLARLGSYENFEAAVVNWMATRSGDNNDKVNSQLLAESQHILRHLDL